MSTAALPGLCRPYFRKLDPQIHRPRAGTQPRPWDMPALCAAYNFPKIVVSATELPTIGIIELGGGYDPADIQAAFAKWGLPAPVITALGPNSPGGDADGEVVLDIEISAAAYSYCTGRPAQLRVYFAPNTNAGFAAAIKQAAADGCVVCSVSWGSAEPQWGRSVCLSFDAMLAAATANMTIFVAAGDNDSGDGTSGVAVDFPGSSPHVVCCGGTQKLLNMVETVWNSGAGEGTGGGFSQYFPTQTFQVGAPAGAGRMVPDLAANADPATGYNIFLNGQWQPIGGTSAVAPLMAGLFAAMYGAGLQGGFITDRLYRHPAAFTDIVTGNNGRWRATSGIDPCTGLGAADGTLLWTGLVGSAPGPVVPPTPPVNPPTPAPQGLIINVAAGQMVLPTGSTIASAKPEWWSDARAMVYRKTSEAAGMDLYPMEIVKDQ